MWNGGTYFTSHASRIKKNVTDRNTVIIHESILDKTLKCDMYKL